MEDRIKTLRDFEIFSRALIASRDVDPTYIVIKRIIDMFKFEPNWFAFVYVSFYSLKSAIETCFQMPKKELFRWHDFVDLRKKINHFGIERRGHIRVAETHANVLEEIANWLSLFSDEALSKDNQHFRTRIEELTHHGGWASFKLAEVFEKALKHEQLKIPDLGLDGRNPNKNDGPVGGLRWLYGRDLKYNKKDFDVWNEFGHNLAKAWGTDIGEVETCLCKWHKLKTGKYFVGHDIQEFLELRHVLEDDEFEEIMEGFDERFWKGKEHLEKSNKRLYLKKNKLINLDFAEELPKSDIVNIFIES